MLYLIGMGLHSFEDLSLKSIGILKRSKHIYYENYTSILQKPLEELEKYINKKITICHREIIETSDIFFEQAKSNTVSILVAGTPLFATTHIDIVLKAKEINVELEIIHNASILNVYGYLGLYSYHFGKVVSIPYFTDTWKPTSFYDNIVKNYKNGYHTLCLLDIKVDENRYMKANEALYQILESERLTKLNCLDEKTKVFVVSRFGSPDQVVAYESIENLLEKDFGAPLHSLVIPSKLDVVENEIVSELFK